MKKLHLDPWEREPLWLKLLTPYLRSRRFPYLDGEAEIGKWVRISGGECVGANGDPTYADFYRGSENKLLVFFAGGGVSWNAYTAARPSSIYARDIQNTFYMIRTDLFTDFRMERGIFESSERNPFRNWSKLVVTYDTGDFHIGTGDFPYTALDGSERICRHHGYTNYRKFMETVQRIVPTPEALLVCGCSGGAFGAALLTDDLAGLYPDCANVTCLVDSGFFPLDGWHDIARDVWQAPEEITDRIHSDNITLDALQALYREQNGRIKILLCSTVRDSGLSRMMNYTKHGAFAFTRESGDELQAWLKDMLHTVRETIPTAGLYLCAVSDHAQKKNGLTKHCLIGDPEVFTERVEGRTCAEWIMDAVNDQIESIGLSKLEG